MKDHVVSLGVAKELNEKLNSAEDSALYWVKFSKDDKWQLSGNSLGFDCYNSFFKWSYVIPTYTLTEMLDILPARIDDKWWLHIDKAGAHYLNDNFDALYGHTVDDKTNPVTATAKLIISLINNGHIKGENQC